MPVRTCKLPRRERLADPCSHKLLAFRLDGEQNPQLELIAIALRGRVVRRKRTRRFVYPVAAERDGDCGPGSAVVAAWLELQHGVVSVDPAHPASVAT